MFIFTTAKKSFKRYLRWVCSLFLGLIFLASSVLPAGISYGQVISPTILNLPLPGSLVTTTAGFIPPLIKGLTIYPNNPLEFNFIVDTGQSGIKIENPEFRTESRKLIKYFLAALTIPDENMWVNLSPYEKDHIISAGFGQTEMGRDLLAQDYLLKQLMASLTYPEDELGKSFWDKVYAKAHELYGTTNIPINTFNKIWIVPDKAVVYEIGQTAYVIKTHLKVMLEGDYLALKESLLGQVYVDQNKIKGVDLEDKTAKEKIYQQYLEAFKKGVYSYIKEDTDPVTQKSIPRKYFSGGFDPQLEKVVNDGDDAKVTDPSQFSSEEERTFVEDFTRPEAEAKKNRAVADVKIALAEVGENGNIDAAALAIHEEEQAKVQNSLEEKRGHYDSYISESNSKLRKVHLVQVLSEPRELEDLSRPGLLARGIINYKFIKNILLNGFFPSATKIGDGSLTEYPAIFMGINREGGLDRNEGLRYGNITNPKNFGLMVFLSDQIKDTTIYNYSDGYPTPEVKIKQLTAEEKEKNSQLKDSFGPEMITGLAVHRAHLSKLLQLLDEVKTEKPFLSKVPIYVFHSLGPDYSISEIINDVLRRKYKLSISGNLDRDLYNDIRNISSQEQLVARLKAAYPILQEKPEALNDLVAKFSEQLGFGAEKSGERVDPAALGEKEDITQIIMPLMEESYQKVLGEIEEERKGWTKTDQVHPIDREFKVDSSNIHKSMICNRANPMFREMLVERGYDAINTYNTLDSMDRSIYNPKVLKALAHQFILLRINGRSWVIDGAWQQFLPLGKENNPNLPKVFISEVSELKHTLAELGLSQEYQQEIWLSAPEVAALLSTEPSTNVQVPSSEVDNASLTKVGGIDLNPKLLDLQIKRDGNGVPLPLPQQPIGTMNIQGFLPIIVDVLPVSIPLLLGLQDDQRP